MVVSLGLVCMVVSLGVVCMVVSLGVVCMAVFLKSHPHNARTAHADHQSTWWE